MKNYIIEAKYVGSTYDNYQN